jgi:hypothetical protein
LIELVAVSIHQIAIILYKLNFDLGKHHDWAAWVAQTSDTIFYRMYPVGKLPTLFFHHQYRNDKQYPQGPADIVGYWAESQVFGAVVLLDRRHSDEREPHEYVGFSASSHPTAA